MEERKDTQINSQTKDKKKYSADYLRNKKIYDDWRKANPLKQAWHQFNHSRKAVGKQQYSFENYVALRYDLNNLTSDGKLKSKFTKTLP